MFWKKSKLTHQSFNKMYASRKEDALLLSSHLCFNPQEAERKGVFVLGAAGSGKGMQYVLPNVLRANKNYVVPFFSGEIIGTKYNEIKKAGYEIKEVDLETFNGIHYNPLEYVKNEADANLIAKNILQNIRKKECDQYWIIAGEALLSGIILYVKEMYPKEEQNLITVKKVILASETGKTIKDIIEELKIKSPHNAAIKKLQKAIYDPKAYKSIAISVLLEMQYEKPLENMLSADDLDLYNFSNKKQMLFIKRTRNSQRMEPLVTLLMSQLNSILFAQSKITCKETCHFILDDACEIIPFITASNVEYSFIFQSWIQFKALYKDKAEEVLKKCEVLLLMGSTDWALQEVKFNFAIIDKKETLYSNEVLCIPLNMKFDFLEPIKDKKIIYKENVFSITHEAKTSESVNFLIE